MFKKFFKVFGLVGSLFASNAFADGHATLKQVQDRGHLQCGVSQGLFGFSNPDDAGNWTGLDVDFCRAMAAAIFNDPQAVKFTPLSSKQRFTALSSGEIDVLARNTTWTMTRDASLGLNFSVVNYYDGQGMMVPKSLGVTSGTELDGANVCTQTGTTTELNITDYFRMNNMSINVVAYEDAADVIAAYGEGRCDVYTTDKSGVAAQRLRLSNPDDHMLLPEVISKEPLGPVVRQGDDNWLNIVKWTHFAMLNAEEMGVTQANIDSHMNSTDPAMLRLLGKEGTFGEYIGLSNDWAVRIIKAVGNYSESYERNVGPNTPLQLDRGVNALWTNGGLQYGPPIR
jgi:general L-amino acid transport system substrate-binding protein